MSNQLRPAVGNNVKPPKPPAPDSKNGPVVIHPHPANDILTFSSLLNKLLRLAKKDDLTLEQINQCKVLFTKLNEYSNRFTIQKKYEKTLLDLLVRVTKVFETMESVKEKTNAGINEEITSSPSSPSTTPAG
jgi:hypothetical protein